MWNCFLAAAVHWTNTKACLWPFMCINSGADPLFNLKYHFLISSYLSLNIKVCQENAHILSLECYREKMQNISSLITIASFETKIARNVFVDQYAQYVPLNYSHFNSNQNIVHLSNGTSVPDASVDLMIALFAALGKEATTPNNHQFIMLILNLSNYP